MKVHKDPSKFLSTEDVHDQEIVDIAGEGEEIECKYGLRLSIPLKVKGGIKFITLNPTSKSNLIDTYGDDTFLWIGKPCRVHILKNFKNGETKNIFYFTHPNKDLEGNDIVKG